MPAAPGSAWHRGGPRANAPSGSVVLTDVCPCTTDSGGCWVCHFTSLSLCFFSSKMGSTTHACVRLSPTTNSVFRKYPSVSLSLNIISNLSPILPGGRDRLKPTEGLFALCWWGHIAGPVGLHSAKVTSLLNKLKLTKYKQEERKVRRMLIPEWCSGRGCRDWWQKRENKWTCNTVDLLWTF